MVSSSEVVVSDLFLCIVCWEDFFSNMDTSMRTLYECGVRTQPIQYSPSQIYLDNKRSYTSIMTEDLTYSLLSQNNTRESLVALGLFKTLPSTNEVIQLFSRTLFRPKLELRTYIDTFLKDLNALPSIGVQIRTGGKMANVKEDNCFFSNETIYRVIDKINDVISEHDIFDYNLFLSTDSYFVLGAMREYFPQLLSTSSKFEVGHTSLARNGYKKTYAERAIIDLSLLSKCTYLITTKFSSYGTLSSMLSHSMYVYSVDWKSLLVFKKHYTHSIPVQQVASDLSSVSAFSTSTASR